MKIKKVLQKIFKNFFKFIFHILYGKIKLNNDKSNILFKKQSIKKIIISGKEYITNHQIYELIDTRIYTDLVEHVAIIKNNFILPEISYQQIGGELKQVSENKVLKSGTTRLIKKYDGNVLSLVQGASGNNYFHFLFDIIVKIKLFEEKYSLEDIDYFYMPGTNEWQKKIISKFGIYENRLINSQKFRHIKADKVFALDHPWYRKDKVQKEIQNLPDWIIHYLRDKFLKYSKKFEASDKIFIDRSDSNYNHCKLINNQEVINFLSGFGFKSYQVSKLDFFEQIYLFNNARTIIGPHGAAFSNIIFSEPGLKLIELMPENHPSIKCKKISSILNFDYRKVNLKYISNSQKDINGDMKISIDHLKDILKALN